MGDDGQDTTIPLRDLRGRLDTACGRLVDSMAVELGVRAKLDEIAELPVAEALRRSSEDLDLHYCVNVHRVGLLGGAAVGVVRATSPPAPTGRAARRARAQPRRPRQRSRDLTNR